MTIETIPLNKLTLSPDNVRKTGGKDGIDELAASIKAHGLLQNLQVKKTAEGKFEVVAGGRRLAALKLLVKEKAIAKNEGILCNLLDDQDAGEISLAENIIRLPMHPADQFVAFKELADAGKGPEEIAARFGATPTIVRQRLKLANISPFLIALYRDEEMTLDQLMAFAVSDDHAAQEAAWFEQPEFNRRPAMIRRILTEAHAEANDRRTLFVGIEAYVAAGGDVKRDLFQPQHEGYLTDPALLDRLVTERLESAAEVVRAEGWAWVEIMPEIDWATLRRFERVEPERRELLPEQAEERERLAREHDALVEAHGDDPGDEIVTQLEAMSERIDELDAAKIFWPESDKAQCGVLVGIGPMGETEIERGLRRTRDSAAAEDDGGDEFSSEPIAAPCPAPGTEGLSERLIEDLTAHRTGALRGLLADDPATALAAVTHALTLARFYDDYAGANTCLNLQTHCADLNRHAEGFGDSRAGRLLAERHAHWQALLPQEEAGLWPWLLAQPPETVTALLAYCAASSIDAVRKKLVGRYAPHSAHADCLAGTLGLDMGDWWQPTAASFFGRVSKAVILQAVEEGCSRNAADNLVKLKKEALAAAAAERVAGSGWLPVLFRPATPDPVFEAVAEEPVVEAQEEEPYLAAAA